MGDTPELVGCRIGSHGPPVMDDQLALPRLVVVVVCPAVTTLASCRARPGRSGRVRSVARCLAVEFRRVEEVPHFALSKKGR